MAAKPLVYVHGAGRQDPPAKLKHDLDMLLYGAEVATTRVAYYADVRWPIPAAGAVHGLGLAGSASAQRGQAVLRAAAPGLTARAAATEIVRASLARPVAPARAPGRGRRGLAAALEPPPEAAPPDAVDLVEKFYRRADVIARHSARPHPRPGAAFGLGFPDPIFRVVVGRFASDVVDYLFGGFAERMREPVRQVLLAGPPPKVIVAHSLGTIVLYDVLSDPAFPRFDVELLVTVGCPLGIGNVQDRLRDGAGRPNPVPSRLASWANFADRWDPVALDASLRDEFDPPKNFARDKAVNNPAPNNHDLTGYLSVGIVQSTIVTGTGQP